MAKIYEFEKEPEIEEIQMSYKTMMELLDTLKENPYYKLQFENIKIISKAVVEEKIEKLNEILIGLDYHDIEDKEEREFYKKEYGKYVCVRNEVQELLNKGE